MSSEDDRLRRLLDGDLSPEELEEDPMLAGLAERVYGEDFLDEMGVSRGESQRALTEALQDDDVGELMIELPDEIPEFEPPSMTDFSTEKSTGRKGICGISVAVGGLLVVAINLFYGLGNIIGVCSSDVHISCSQNMKLNLLEFHRTAEHIAWSPTGVVGIPDMAAAGLMGVLFISSVMKRRRD